MKREAVALAALAAISPAAEAAVISWDYAVEAAFTGATFSGGTTPAFPATTLSWGRSSVGPSSLAIAPFLVEGQVDTFIGIGTPPAGFAAPGISLTHNNRPITGGSLRTAVLSTSVILDPLIPDGAPLAPMGFDISIGFSETPNSGTCAVADSPTPCNDIFVLIGGLPNFNFFYDAGDGDGLVEYLVNVFPLAGDSLGALDDAACLAAGQPAGCVGLTTPERQSSTVPFGFTISAAPVPTGPLPTPGTLGLLAAALVAGAMLRRAAA